MLTREAVIKLLQQIIDSKVEDTFVSSNFLRDILLVILRQQPEQPRRMVVSTSICAQDNITEIVTSYDDESQYYLKIEEWNDFCRGSKWQKLPPIPQDDDK
jgi:hypothetical protein